MIGLHVVVVPAFSRGEPEARSRISRAARETPPPRSGCQGRQTEQADTFRDLLLVDQRGTGRSKRHDADVTQYGTRMAMDDLDAVRAALGYRQLDVFGSSYGATAAQVYLKLYPSLGAHTHPHGRDRDRHPLLRPLRGQRPARPRPARGTLRLRTRLPQGIPGLGATVRRARQGLERASGADDGDELASVVHVMLLDREKAVSIPLVVSRAAKGDYGPLQRAGSGDLDIGDLSVMGSSIWCNEPWAGIDAKGPWGTDFDSYTSAKIAAFRKECSSVPRRAEPHSLWALPVSSRVPVLAFVGGADPQDPITNLPNLKRQFPDSRAVILPHTGHRFYIGSCVDQMMADFVAHGTTKGLHTTSCDGLVVVPPFPLTD